MKKILLLLAVSLATLSCVVDKEDRNHANANSPYIMGFSKAKEVVSYVASGSIQDLDLKVILIGGQDGLPNNSDITFTYEADPTSTAVLGTHYDFASPVHTGVIKAGTTFATIPLKIKTGSLPTGYLPSGAPVVPVFVNVKITSSNVVIGKQFELDKLTINGLCFSNLAKTYNLITTRLATGAVYNLPGEVISATGTGTYLTSSTGPYNNRGAVSAGAQVPSSTPGFNFTDVCNNITLESQMLCNLYSNLVTQSPIQAAGSSKASNGVITILYSITFASGVRDYRGVYTPIP